MLKRLPVLVYGIICYLIGATAYFVGFGGFLANLLGRYSVDANTQSTGFTAIIINGGLILLFGIPHSLMARQGFKRVWTRIIPPAMERSTYMLQAGILAGVLIWQWQPMPATIWKIDNSILQAVIWVSYFGGWLIAFISTYLINHFELSGLQQTYLYFRGKDPVPMTYRTPFLYKIVRHPMQLGVMIAFWATPHMTLGHLVFSIGMTGYIAVGLYFEERDLVKAFGQTYRDYQKTTPMLFPIPQLKQSTPSRTQKSGANLS